MERISPIEGGRRAHERQLRAILDKLARHLVSTVAPTCGDLAILLMHSTVPECTRSYRNALDRTGMHTIVPESTRSYRNALDRTGMHTIVPECKRSYRNAHDHTGMHTISTTIDDATKNPSMAVVDPSYNAAHYTTILRRRSRCVASRRVASRRYRVVYVAVVSCSVRRALDQKRWQ